MQTFESLAIVPNIYYTLEESAQLLRVPQPAVLSLLESGQVGGVRIGQDWRVLGAALLALTGVRQESEAEHFTDWRQASANALRELWDNEEDAVYDHKEH